MDADYSPGEEHELFAEWAFAQGVIANGVTPARFPGRGLGMIATREIKVGDSERFKVPVRYLQTLTVFMELERRSIGSGPYQYHFHR